LFKVSRSQVQVPEGSDGPVGSDGSNDSDVQLVQNGQKEQISDYSEDQK